jgi:GAF domain-containing protein
MATSMDDIVDDIAPEPGGAPVDPLASAAADEQLAAEFADLARELAQDPTLHGTASRIVKLAVATVPGCEQAAITVIRRGQFESVATTGELPLAVDALQYETGEGPCVDSIRTHEVFRSADLGAESRWPRFAPLVVERTGVRSMLAFRLFAESDTLGALNLYALPANAFSDEVLPTAGIYATHAALAFARSRAEDEVDNLEQALSTNREIAMAMGILMGQRRLTEQEAFAQLRVASQTLNRKLRDIAAAVVQTGEVPGR